VFVVRCGAWVSQPQLQRTIFASPQLELWELDDEQWRKVLERTARPRRAKPLRTDSVEQLAFQIAGLILLLLMIAGTLHQG
jgi:hypothetical protein